MICGLGEPFDLDQTVDKVAVCIPQNGLEVDACHSPEAVYILQVLKVDPCHFRRRCSHVNTFLLYKTLKKFAIRVIRVVSNPNLLKQQEKVLKGGNKW